MSAALAFVPFETNHGDRRFRIRSGHAVRTGGSWHFVSHKAEQRRELARRPSDRWVAHVEDEPAAEGSTRPARRSDTHWLEIWKVLLRFFRGDLDSVGEVLATPQIHKFAATSASLDELKAYALGIALNVRADERARLAEQRRQERQWPQDDDGCPLEVPCGPSEDEIISHIDRARGPMLLTAPAEREFFWTDVHDWCADNIRLRFGRSFSAPSDELTPQDSVGLALDGRALTPEEATWQRLRSIRTCPADLEIWSDKRRSEKDPEQFDKTDTRIACPRDVFVRLYPAVKKAFQRAAVKKNRKNDKVSPAVASKRGLHSQRPRF